MRVKALAICAVLTGVAFTATSDSADACCYPVFERTKPHLNLGTIGNNGQPALSAQQAGQSGNSSNGASNHRRRAKPRKGEQRELLILIRPELTVPTN